ncbi:hypothetical protein SORBI_3008G060200 [Sorghum bicolor]|uniref:Protein kinase domain-containing protein n=1 Tax=Sorghum bicolor TaxID=4558 RepID=A0A1B6PBI3_SORBI|nr:hypothetical protein SORBI_3008G060200 [Sorghum bicolor]
MVYKRYCLRDLNCFLLLLAHLFLFLFPSKSVATVDVPCSVPPNKTQEAIMKNLSRVVGDSWGFSTNMCLWVGVACSCSGSGSSMVVTNITLSNYGISDTSIFSSLCLLDTLLSLDLSRNSFTNLGDKFSDTSCRMKEGLLSLNLSHNHHNHLSGAIPSDLGFSSELAILDLSYNNLSGEVPSSLWNLQSLTQLVLSYNNLSGFVPGFRQNVDIDIVGNPDLVTGTGNNNYTPSPSSSSSTWKRRAHNVVVTIFAAASALVGICFLVVIAVISSPKRTYRVDNVRIPPGEDDSQITNGGLIAMNCFRTSAIMFMKEKQDEWRMTAFQTLNFEAADILQGLTEENLVGSGGSGQVYRVSYTNQYNKSIGVVAVKQIRSFGSLDELLEHEFESEASILCNIRHNNIVRLLCCLSGADSKLLVYDYMDNGNLDRWLHGDYVLRARHPMAKARPVQRVPLDWPTRLIVAVGAAQGLCYMHHHCSPPIIHRDVKTSNILLDSEFRAKVADFGLARMLMQAGEPNTMTWVVGSFGYMAPEYAYTRKVNEKVDVFGFGVVLLELTTDKNANDGGDHGSLAEWAGHHYRSGASIPDATDICIRYAGYADEIETVFRLGVKCTANSPSSRPTMEDVLQILLKCSEQTLRKSRLECSIE